jgi:D-alanyl-D-alanine carboxypeptidase
MFSMTYPAGEKGLPPPVDFDPGRVRYAPLFRRMYGDCAAASGFMRNAIDVTWLPTRSGSRLKFTKINNAAAALQDVSRELDKLAASFTEYLVPTAGTYNCRSIAGTDRVSPHAFGIAIDINTKKSDYWLWSKPQPGPSHYRNQIPWQIVDVFERHGFIWGGKWYHYDTMHFEYRPEITGTAE